MADKSFGVKELNLLNASGTPTITSPNNLNLNANTVAISTSVTIGHNLTVSANAGISSLNVSGVSTFVGLTTFKSDIHIVGNQAIDINNNALLLRGNNGGNGFITNSIGHLYISSLNDVENLCTNNFSVKTNTSEQAILATKNGSVALYHDGGNKKLETSNTGVTVTGTLAATAVTGDGSGLTGISAGISTSPSNVQATWKLGGGSGSGFTFTGPGQDGSEGNPDIYLVRGQRYLFDNTTLAGNHPFEFRNEANDADYTDGVSGAQNGLQYINVQHDAPAALKYRCTIHTSSMLGNIYIVGQHLANGADNRVLTATSAYGMNGESGLLFTGTNLGIGNRTSSPDQLLHVHTSSGDAVIHVEAGADPKLRLRAHSGESIIQFADASSSNTGEINYVHSGDYLKFRVNASERLRIDSNGDLGLGIAPVPQDSGARTLHIHDSDTGSAARAAIRLTHGSTGSSASNGGFLGIDGNPDLYLYNQENGNLRFGTNGSERFRVDSGGRVQIGTTSAIQNSLLTLVSGNGVRVLVCQSGGIGANDAILFRNPNGDVGRIVTTGSSTSYNISSDYRLKENLVAISDGITRLKTLKPYRFNFIKTPDTTVDGFLAHEVTAVPEAITGTKDEVDSDNNPVYQGIDQSKLVPLLTAALQEAITKIETLEAEVATLKGS